MRFIEIPALITEDIEDPSIADITEEISVSISGTTMTIDGGSKVSGEATVTLTGDTTVNAFTLQNIRAPSLHKISVKTGRKGNFTYVPNNTMTASSVSTTTKTGSDFEILLITTNGGETYVDFDMADYTSPALYTSNALTGFDISELTSTYGATAKLYKPDGTLLTTVSAAGSGVNFGYTETEPGDVIYKLEVTDDLGRKSKYDLPRKWISYAMSSPGFEKLELAGNEYTTTTIVPNLTPSSKAKVFRTNNHGYLGINFKIQGRNSTGDDWVDIANADEDDEVLAFGDYLYHRVWVKPTAKATTTVSSSNVVTITLSNLTEENVTTSFTGADPFDINESTNTYVFEETTKIGTVPYTVTLGSETYTNAVTVTTEGTAYDYVTLAFANPTLSLTTSNVTISSAKLYRDDVLFHTYGTESNVVLRSDQTGTYQAIVNDVYYSNRVTPDFTTTRSVSAPQLEFDGYNRLNLSNSTPTSTTLGLPDGTTRDLTTQSNVYIYETGTYTANVQTSDTFAYLSNVVTSQPSQNSADVGPTFTFDGYNRLAISNLTQTSSTLKYGSNTYDTNTASNVYVTDAGEYKLEARDANTFVMSNVYVGAVSQHLSDVVPTLTFDGYNKLTIENDGNGDTGMKNVTISGGPWNTLTFKPDDNAQKGKFQWDLWSSTANYQIGNKHNLEYVPGYGWYVLNQDGTGFGDVTPTSATSGTYLDGNGVSQTFSTNLASSSGGVLSIAHTAGTMTVNESDFFEGGIFPPKVGSLESVTIKKDGVAFATTTSDTVYIRDTGTYTAEVKGSGAYAIELSNVVTGSVIPNVVFPSSSNQALVSTDGSVKWPSANDNIDGQTALDASGTTLAIGTIDGNGAIYVFEKTNGVWTQVQKMTANIPASSAFFGGAISISGDIIVTCTYGPNNSDGFVYVFEKTNGVWPSTETVKMDPQYERLTGIDIYGTTIVATERHETNRGRFYIFEKTNGLWPSNYTSRIDTGTGYFTWCSAMYGDNLAIMHVRAGTTYSYVLFYERDVSGQWNYLETKGTSEGQQTGSAGGSFGRVMSMYDTTVAITGLYDDSNKGNVYVYKKSNGTWVFDEKISNHGITNERFGMSLKLISETKLLIGSYGHAYIYEDIGGTWTETFKFEGADNTDFGKYSTLSSDGNTAFISDTSYNSNQGAVYVYEKGPAGPNITYDGKNKLTLNQLNYEDTATVTVPNESTYNLGTVKTIYVKDTGEYVFKISGTDKYVESNVYVSSVDLAGAPTKPIDFDGYNKLTLIDAGSNVSANVKYFSNTYEMGSANVLYINGAGTYDLEMSGSNVFALSSNVVSGTVNSQRNATYKDFTYTETRIKSTWDNYDTTHSPPKDFTFKTGSDFNNSTLIGLGYTEGFDVSRWWIVSSDTHDFATHGTGTSVSHYNWGSDGTVAVNQGTEYAWFTRTIPSTVVDVSGTYKVNLGAQLTFDNYNKLTLENFTTVNDKQWPPTDGTRSSPTWSDSDKVADWTITGASYGNGSYKGTSSVAVWSDSSNHAGPYWAFNNDDSTADDECWHPQSIVVAILTIEMPSSMVLGSYELYYRNYTDYTCGPKDWTVEGSNDGSTWTVLDTRTNQPQVTAALAKIGTYTVSNSTSYSKYRLNVTENHGGDQTIIGEWKLFEKNTRTATLTDPNGNTYSLGQTQNDIYIEDTGEYILEVTNSDQSAVVKTNVGTVTEEVEVSPQLWWNTYTNSSTVDDSSPNNLDGTLNSVTDTDGAFTFDGSSSYIQMATTGATDSNVQLAMWDISCEFYKTGSGTTGGYIDRQAVVLVTKGINAGDGGGYDINYGLVIDSNNKLCTGFEEAGSNQITIESTTTINNNQWYTARATFDGTTLNLYLDDTLEATATPTISPASSDLGPFMVGAGRYDTSHTPAAYFQGRIKNVKVYNDIFISVPQPPSLTFDGYNKLSIENLTPTSTRLTYGSNTYEIGTASNVYIEHEGTYKMATGDATTFALVSKEVGTQPSGTTYNLTSLTRVSNYSTTNTSKAQVSGNGTWPVSSFMATHNVLNNGDKAYGKTDGGSSRDPAQLFDTISSGWGEASHGTNGTHSPMSWGYEFTSGAKMISKMILYQPPNTHPAGNVTIKYWDGTSMTTVSNQSPIGMTSEVALSSTEFTFDAVSSQYWQIDCYRHATQTTGYTGLSEWEIYGNVITTINTPSLTYDTSNKLSIENLTPTSTILTDPNGSSFDIGTALNVYIRDSGTYSIASKDANTFVLTSNTVTGTPTGTTYTHTILTGSHTRISDRDASNTNRTHNSGSSDWPDSNSGITHYQDLSNGDRSYQKTNGGDSRDAAQLFDGVDSGNWGNASHGNVGTHSPMTWGYKFTSGSKQCSQMILVQPPNTHHAGNVTIKYWDGTSMTAVSNQSPLSMDNQKTDNDPTTFTFDAVSSQFWQIDCYRGSDNSTGYTGLHAWEIYDNPYEYVTGTTPSQTYDNTKTITVKNVPSTLTDVAGKIYKGSTAYTIHATTSSSNVIIENAGTYVSVFTTATQAFLTNAIDATEPTTTSDDTTIEDEGFIPGSTAVTTVTTTDAPSVTLDATDTTVTDPTLDLDFTTTLPRTLKRYNGVTNSSIGARFNRRETYKKRIEKSINISTRFSAELTANNASSPTTLTVTVANSKFVINGDETPTLGFIRGETYTFDQSDASNSGHPLVLATSEDGATQYTTGWTASGTPGTDGSHAFIVPYDVPDTIYYKCTNHANMGGEINTTFGNVFSLGDFTVAANTHVSGEYMLATNYDGTTSNLYVNGFLITQTTPSPAISAGVKEFILGKEFDGYVKNFKFWNYAKRFRPPGIYPQTLPSIDSSGIWHNSTEYRWRSSEPGYEIYGRWRIDFSPEAFDAENENIRVNTTTNIWEDSGTANPTGVTDGSTVTLTIDNGASVLYKFTKPTDASWID